MRFSNSTNAADEVLSTQAASFYEYDESNSCNSREEAQIDANGKRDGEKLPTIPCTSISSDMVTTINPHYLSLISMLEHIEEGEDFLGPIIAQPIFARSVLAFSFVFRKIRKSYSNRSPCGNSYASALSIDRCSCHIPSHHTPSCHMPPQKLRSPSDALS